jgi:hypothetical protein
MREVRVNNPLEQDVKEAGEGLNRLHWLGASCLAGFFFGFVDTLATACVLGYVSIQVPAQVGIPTTFSGFFFTGVLVGKLAPARIKWEVPLGILICVLLFMAGFAGFGGQGTLLLLVHYVILPAVAVGLSYAGLEIGRRGFKSFWKTLWKARERA